MDGEAMSPEQIEDADCEADLRAEHRPEMHGNEPCPSGGCCECQIAGVCDAGLALVLLDKSRAENARLLARVGDLEGERANLLVAWDRVLATEPDMWSVKGHPRMRATVGLEEFQALMKAFAAHADGAVDAGEGA